jgi:hypothetical protein
MVKYPAGGIMLAVLELGLNFDFSATSIANRSAIAPFVHPGGPPVL